MFSESVPSNPAFGSFQALATCLLMYPTPRIVSVGVGVNVSVNAGGGVLVSISGVSVKGAEAVV